VREERSRLCADALYRIRGLIPRDEFHALVVALASEQRLARRERLQWTLNAFERIRLARLAKIAAYR
jgi:hypothetical protein